MRGKVVKASEETKRTKPFREELEFQGVKFDLSLPRALYIKLILLDIFECMVSLTGAMLIFFLPAVVIAVFGGEEVIESMMELQPIGVGAILVFLFGMGMQDLAGYLAQKRGCKVELGFAQVRIVGLMSMSAVLLATWIALMKATSLDSVNQTLGFCVAYFVGYGHRRLTMVIRRQSCKIVAKFVAEDYTAVVAEEIFPQLKRIFTCKDYMDD